jgi:hypothetical protein
VRSRGDLIISQLYPDRRQDLLQRDEDRRPIETPPELDRHLGPWRGPEGPLGDFAGSRHLDPAGRRPRPGGALAGPIDRDFDRDDLDFAADSVANAGERKSRKEDVRYPIAKARGLQLDSPRVPASDQHRLLNQAI